MNQLFERASEYDEMLERGVSLSGEDKSYFFKGRVQHMISRLPRKFSPESILDFGCGVGDTTHYLHERYPHALVTGADISQEALTHADRKYANQRVTFSAVDDLRAAEHFDLCYTNGVFHHIDPLARPIALQKILALLKTDAWLSLFENNPLNLATHLVMKRIPFDRDAKMMSHLSARRLVVQSMSARVVGIQFLFYFPRGLAPLRLFERLLRPVPLGTQYHLLARKCVGSPSH